MSTIKFRLAAKTDPGCVRTNNEDNFQAAADLADGKMTWINNQTYDLGDKGALLVVADGMGGMNAGEVASDIAIQTIREFFAPENLTPEVLKNRFTIEKFMKEVVVAADSRIKKQSTEETRGMGTTIVIAWLLDGQCYICWCGDSRAYIYNKENGLFQVSRDHSYVQNLVDEGKITQEEAFDYPGSNVITRCLCDAKQKAEPDCLLSPQPLCNGDIILLCSDGLSGMLHDAEMQKIIEEGPKDINELTDKLIDAALAAGGNDNVTVAAACIDEGGAQATAERVPVRVLPKPHVEAPAAANAATQTAAPKKEAADAAETTPAKPKEEKKKGSKAWVWGLITFLLVIAAMAAVYTVYFDESGESDKKDKDETEQVDEDDAKDADDEAETAEGEELEVSDEGTTEVAAPATVNPVKTPNSKTSTAPKDEEETPTSASTEEPAAPTIDKKAILSSKGSVVGEDPAGDPTPKPKDE